MNLIRKREDSKAITPLNSNKGDKRNMIYAERKMHLRFFDASDPIDLL